MLSVFSIDAMALVSEKDFYVPVETAAFILAYGTTGSGHDLVAHALSYYAPNSRDWLAVERFAQITAALAIAGMSASVVAQDPSPVCWYMGELAYVQDTVAELDALVAMLQAGSQVIAYVHAADPLVRLHAAYRECEPSQLSMLERLIAERGSRTIEVVRPSRAGEVQVRTKDRIRTV